MDYLLHVLVLIAIFGSLAISLDLLVGHCGLFSLTHVGFYAIGAYSSALLTLRVHFSVLWALIVAAVISAIASLIVSLPSLRLRGDQFVIASFSFQLIIVGILNNWLGFTRGPLGISGIPQPDFLRYGISPRIGFSIVALCLVIFSCLLVNLLTNSPFGQILHAIREDELLAESLGKNVFKVKVQVFAVSAGLAGLAGGLYAHYATFIDPSSFSIMESIMVVSMVVIGGAGSLFGPLVGAAFLIGLPEGLRFIGLSGPLAANLRQIFYGIILITMMFTRPAGLLGRFQIGGGSS